MAIDDDEKRQICFTSSRPRHSRHRGRSAHIYLWFLWSVVIHRHQPTKPAKTTRWRSVSVVAVAREVGLVHIVHSTRWKKEHARIKTHTTAFISSFHYCIQWSASSSFTLTSSSSFWNFLIYFSILCVSSCRTYFPFRFHFRSWLRWTFAFCCLFSGDPCSTTRLNGNTRVVATFSGNEPLKFLGRILSNLIDCRGRTCPKRD